MCFLVKSTVDYGFFSFTRISDVEIILLFKVFFFKIFEALWIKYMAPGVKILKRGGCVCGDV